MMQRVLVGLLALLSCALAAPVAPATAATPLKPVAKAKGGGRSDMMKGLAATLSPDNKKAFKALVAEKKLAKGEAAIPRPQRTPLLGASYASFVAAKAAKKGGAKAVGAAPKRRLLRAPRTKKKVAA